MRRFALLALSLAVTQAFALGSSQEDTLTSAHYQESPEEAAVREFKERKAELPPLPDAQSGDWFDLYVNETYGKQPKILPSSPQIMPAPGNSIRYVLNARSDKGYDNLSVEDLYCTRTSFTYSNDKRSSYKIFTYGNTVNRCWIEPRKGDWKLIGNAFSCNDALHTVLYQTFCIDGMPATVEGLVQHLRERGDRHGTTLSNHDK